jgi:hypothetical protein
LNTLHLKPRPKKRYKAVIDATEIFESEELRNFDFEEVDIEEVQICEMGAKEVDGEIRYKSVGGFKLDEAMAGEKENQNRTLDEGKTDEGIFDVRH